MCNLNGAAKEYYGLCLGTFCIRNIEGNLVMLRLEYLRTCNNLIAYVLDLRHRLEYYVNQGLLPLILKTSSLTLQSILEGI